jgi:hypothetical protein
LRKFLGAGAAALLLVTGGVVGTGTAVAAGDPTFYFEPVEDKVLMPAEGWADLSPPGYGGNTTGNPDGTYIYVLSKKPLTDAAWSGGGAPAGLKVDPTDTCKARTGLAGVYLCNVTGYSGFAAPEVEATSTAANGTTAYYGLVYVPRGGNVDAGIKEAQTAGSKPIGPRRAHATVTIKTKAHVARNTITHSTPAVPAGGTVQHRVTLNAVDKGELVMDFEPAPGFRQWDEGELKVSVSSAGAGGAAGAVCDHGGGELGWGAVSCTITRPGVYNVTYGLKAGATAPAWRLRNYTHYEVYTFGTGNPEKVSDFSVTSGIPVTERHQILGRTPAYGDLYDYHGTGRGSKVFDQGDLVGGALNWNRYSAITKLGPATVQSTGPGAVARDTNGVLWFLRMAWDGGVFLDPLKVGGGWNAFNSLTGVSDLTGDKRADLLARDSAGKLWLYPGTGVTSRPFGTRAQIGHGWQIYNTITGGTDLTGDRKPDVLARDSAGKLWLHAGTGVAAKPLGGRVQVGTGWQIYNTVLAPGDLSSDGKPDLIARDTAGVLWYYPGTGVAAKPYATRVRVGGGWQKFNLVF